MSSRRPREVTVVHLGPVSATSGGIASVCEDLRRGIAVPQVAVDTVGDSLPSSLHRVVRAVGLLLGRAVLGRRSVVHVHLSQGGSFVREGALLRLSGVLGHRVVAQIHGSSFNDFASERASLVRWTLNGADAILVLTDQAAAACRALVNRPDQVVKIVNPAPRSGDCHDPKENIVVMGGTLGVRKGLDVLLGAWARVSTRAPGWELILCGPRDTSAAAAGLDRLPDHCEWWGEVDAETLHALLRRARVAVLPSRAEALPMFLLEAMAQGAIPVGTEVGAVPELLRGIGIVVPPDDTDALAEAMAAVIDMGEDAARQRAVSARTRVHQEYSIARVEGQMLSAWRIQADGIG